MPSVFGNRGWFVFWVVVSGLLVAVGSGCQSNGLDAEDDAKGWARVELAGCENVLQLGGLAYSGAQPHGDAAFAALADAGIETVLSVDGARPALKLAKNYGLRYVHLPIGYDGVGEERTQEIAKAIESLPKPVYIHCHHGKHRGPAAAAAAFVALGKWTPEQAIDFMKAAGTSEKYAGLYRDVAGLSPLSKKTLAAVDGDLPELAALPPFVEAMAAIDRRTGHLKLAQEVRWASPAEHPDVNPAHEALQLHEWFRELTRNMENQPADFQQWMTESVEAARDLENALRAKDGATADAAFHRLRMGCAHCHTVYRNN